MSNTPTLSWKFTHIDWPKTQAKYGYNNHNLKSSDKVIVACRGCCADLEYKFGSIRINHGKPFSPMCHSCGQKKVWTDSAYINHQRTIQQKSTTERWKSNEYRSKVTTGLVNAHATNVTFRQTATAALTSNESKRLDRLKIKRADSSYKNKLATAAVANWNTPEYRNKIITSLNSNDIRTKISIGVKKAWSRPEYANSILLNNKSKLEDHLAAILDNADIVYERQYYLGHWSFDFYIPYSPKHLLIEVHGEYWHGERFGNHRARDQAKATFIQRYHSSEYELKVIWEHEFLSNDRIKHLVSSWFGKQPINIEYKFSDLTISQITAAEANLFMSKYHHTASGGRNGINIGVKLNDITIAVAKYCYPNRTESATKQKLAYREVMELTRFAIHPSYQKHNLASWVLSRTYKLLPKTVKCLITFADTTYGHTGTIYKSSNWQLDGTIRPDYFYKHQSGFIMHKKTLWNQARKMAMGEEEYAIKNGYHKCVGGVKHRFIYKLRG